MLTGAEQIELTPHAVVQQIAETLASACCQRFGTSLRALILTGSVASGEITYRLTDARFHMLSDVDALAILHDSVALPPRQYIEELCSAVELQLRSQGDTHASLTCVHASYLRELPAHIFTFELRAGGVVLCGDPEIINEIPTFAASEISFQDGWRLLGNRLIESLPSGADTDPLGTHAMLKLCLDLASSVLVFFGKFEAGYTARLLAFEALASGSLRNQLPLPIDEFLTMLRACTSAKLNSATYAAVNEQQASNIRSWAWHVWTWELAQLTGAHTESPEDMIGALGHDLSWSSRLRGWLFAARRVGWLKSVAYWPRWMWLFAKGFTPRHALYLAAYRFHAAQKAGRQASVSPLLPVAPVDSSCESVAAQIVWNYQEFVAATRA